MSRITELDALRGIAALGIVLCHLRMGQFPALGSAVDLFFVISGYLITTILLKEGRTRGFLRVFYIRRALRIWPIYYVGIALCYALNPLMPRPDPMNGVGYYLTYTQYVPRYFGYDSGLFSRMFTHSWTLAIEEQFYLFWPALVVLAGRRWLLALSGVLLVTPMVTRSFGMEALLLLARSDGLALGALLAWLFSDRERVRANPTRYRRAFAAALVLGVLAAVVTKASVERVMWVSQRWPGPSWHLILPSIEKTRVAWLYFSVVGLVLCSTGSRWLRPLRNKRLVWLGTISYGIYLYHPLVFSGMNRLALGFGWTRGVALDVVNVVACLVVAGVSWRFLEQPILRFKDRFPYERAGETLRGPHAALGSTGGQATSATRSQEA